MSFQSNSRSAHPVTTKERPRWLRALGASSPPETLEIGGIQHQLAEVFKHDSWAATALYLGSDGSRRVVKIHRQEPAFGVPMRWLGLRTARNERRLLGQLAGLKRIPTLAGPVSVNQKVLENAVAREFVEGHPLGNREAVPDTFFHDLHHLLRGMHARRTVYVDLHKRENIIVSDNGEPCLIDFQISLLWPSWMPLGPIFRIFSRSDEYHLMKHWTRCRPDQRNSDLLSLEERIPWWIRAHRLVARPFREMRRRLLVRLGVRAGKGRVETEVFAEHALRDINSAEPHARPLDRDAA
jgi:hypothetical protein